LTNKNVFNINPSDSSTPQDIQEEFQVEDSSLRRLLLESRKEFRLDFDTEAFP
jgi:hypothetical protein